MTAPDPYRDLTALAEAEGFERQTIDYSGANYLKGGVKLRMIRQGDPGTLRIKATYANGDRLVDVTYDLDGIPDPMLIGMVRSVIEAMGELHSEERCQWCGQTATPWYAHALEVCLRCHPATQVAPCRHEHHAQTVHGGWPPTVDEIREWLENQPAGPLSDAVTAVLDRFEADNLPGWGPKPDTAAEGAYERAHFLFYGLADALLPAIKRDTAPDPEGG